MMRVILLLAALLLTGALAACGSETPADTATPAPTLAPAPTSTPIPTATPASPVTSPATPTPEPAEAERGGNVATAETELKGTPVEGGVLKLLGSDPPTLDPHQTGDSTSARY
ncbi:MAG: hypothetical protein F4X66_11535, partial [Chloroflexi bacterium]|nr:hypothetical protein [Chloroflexota bacterium]